MSRIKLEHTMTDILLEMSEGNPGAVAAIMDLLKHSPEIDPQGSMGGIGGILSLDTLGIYGSEIYVLWSDKCGRDVRRLCLLLRGSQLGLLKSDTIRSMASDSRNEINLTPEEWKNLDDSVCGRLEGFAREVPTECEEEE